MSEARNTRHSRIASWDAPHSLRPVCVNAWRDAPTKNGARVPYDTFGNGRAEPGQPQWYEVELAGGSSFSGSTVTLSNHRELTRLLSKLRLPRRAPVWCVGAGAHETYALFVVYSKVPDELRRVLDGLDDYACVDDQAHAALTNELGMRAWQSWGKRELQRALENDLGAELEHLSDKRWQDLFGLAAKLIGHGWQFETGAQAHFDFVGAARKLSKLVSQSDVGLTRKQARAVEMLVPRRVNQREGKDSA